MRQSSFFFKTQKSFPKDEVATNAQLLIKANFVEKLMAGVYSMLPLGLRVREKIMSIIREEMNALGSSEILMPALQPRAIWDLTGRWETLKKIMYQFEDTSGKEVGLGTTHEEVVVHLAKEVIHSYADLPRAVYQIQTKFRNELRAKSGLIRGREFTMKDLYSFHTDEASLNEFYERAKKAYTKVFDRCGVKTFITEASGGDFSKEYSHEFMVETPAGEDEIFVCRLCGHAQNAEIAKVKAKTQCAKCASGVYEKITSVEVGNIFKLGTRFSEAAGLTYKNKEGKELPVVMGSYGIGVERLMGTIVEVHHDEKGILWPESVAPFTAHLLMIGEPTSQLKKFGDQVYTMLTEKGIETLYDDREKTPAGEKLMDADLIGIPFRIVVSERTIVQEKVEIKKRDEKEARLVKVEEAVRLIKS